MQTPQAPLIIYTELWAQFLPLVALLTRRNWSRPVLWVGGAFALSVASDFVARQVGQATGNNHWVNILSGAVTGTLLLVAVGEWQTTYLERLTVRISIIPFLVAYAALVLWVDDITGFSQYAYPFYMLVILGAAAWTLLRRALQETATPILRADWFWVLGGLVLNSATTAISTPIAAVMMSQHRLDLFSRVWTLRAGFDVLSLLVITIGMLQRPAVPQAL